MPTNKYFNNYTGEGKQAETYRRLINEVIQLFGMDVIYIPRTSESQLDLLFGDDPTKSFTGGYPVAMYIQNTEGFEGPNDLFTKFGLVINKQLRLLVANDAFQSATSGSLGVRPREGDILWFSTFQALFEIKFVNADKFYYAFGSKPFYGYELTCEEFRYNNEIIKTGIDEIDTKVNEVVYTYPMTLGSGNGTYQIGETITQNNGATGIVVSWNKPNLELLVKNIVGSFNASAANTLIIGETSAASYHLTSIEVADNVNSEIENNVLIRTEANTDFDNSESNPFGNPVLGQDNT